MFAIIALLAVVMISIVITRIASTALEATGVSGQLAYFQARSAFTGVGFTTAESESVVGHPVRRRVVLALMLLGNGGLVTVVASLILGFSDLQSFRTGLLRAAMLSAGLLALWGLSATPALTRAVKRAIQRGLDRWTDLEVRDYLQLLDLAEDYAVRELKIGDGDWLADRPLRELELNEEGVLVLGIRRGTGQYLGAPDPDIEIAPGDTVVLYGREDNLTEIDQRRVGPAGERAHDDAVGEQRRVQRSERARDPAR